MKSIIAITITSAFLTACGGGSSGGSDALSTSDFDFIQLDSENANATVAASFQGVGVAGGTELDVAADAESASSAITRAQVLAGEFMRSSYIQSRSAVNEQLDCDQSGSISVTVQGDLSNEGDWIQIAYNNCDDGESITNGTMRVQFNASSLNEADLSATFSELSFVEFSETTTLDGDIRMAWIKSGATQTNTISSNQINMFSSLSGNTVISEMTLQSVSNTDSGSSTLDMSFDVGSDELNGRLVFSTPTLMQYTSSESNPVTGVFRVIGASGSSLTLDANTGNPSTVLFTVFDGSSTSSEEVSWASLGGDDLLDIVDL